MTSLEVLFSPAEFTQLNQRDLTETVCVVFDVLRATSTMVTALANGAKAIIPVSEIAEALEIRKRQRHVLLAGERDGLRISKELTGTISFDLGNSPREFTRTTVAGQTIVMTTTNGTRALRACAHSKLILVGSLLNLRATAAYVEKVSEPNLLLVCSGTFDEAAYEDALAAGALCDLLWPKYAGGTIADSARIVREIYNLHRNDLLGGLSQSRNGQRLIARPELAPDVAVCARLDSQTLVASMGKDGVVRKLARTT